MMVGSYAALQGNLDPTMLYARRNEFVKGKENYWRNSAKGSGHIFNSRVTILPDIPGDRCKKCFLRAVKEENVRYHQN